MEEEISEEKIVDLDKFYDLLYLYKIPLILLLLGLVLVLGAGIFWQSSQKSAEISFSGDIDDNGVTSTSAKIKADIEGAVMKQGVYELASGSRISDLLIMAGGLAAEADRDWVTKNLNLAGKVVDGGKIYIPGVDEAGELGKLGGLGGLGSEKTGNLISINNASLAELDSLPGVGVATAQKIISGRPYQTIDELVQRKIVGKSVFEKIKGQIGL